MRNWFKAGMAVLLWLPLAVTAAESPSEQPSSAVAPAEDTRPPEKISTFRENWILGELRSIRHDMMEYRNDMNRIVTDRELEVADKAMSYASNTVLTFFYVIAVAGGILAIVGWRSVRDLKENVRVYAESEISRLTTEYEKRLEELEVDLRSKSRTIASNQEEIERTNEIHSLWLKASKEPSVQAKIATYDQILELRPDDPEALAWKADAALELGEQRWALSLCDRVLALEPDNTHALYQRACAWADLGEIEACIDDLTRAIDMQETLRRHALTEPHFRKLHENPQFRELAGLRDEA